MIKLKVMELMSIVPDIIFNKIFFIYKNRYWPNFKNPKSFNEKINYIKLYSKYPLRTVAADRLKVRNYILDKVPECNLIPLLWTGYEFTYNIYENLPQKFVIKANHGSGMVLIVDKNIHNFKYVESVVSTWLNLDYGKITRQWVYNDVEKILVVEEFINLGSKILPDFKFICINRTVEFIQVDIDRFEAHRRNIYDRNFNRIHFRLQYPQGDDIKRPKMLMRAIGISEKIAKDFDLIRVDLYLTEDKIYFGELTNTPGNGYDRFYPKEFDFMFGKKLKFIKEFNVE